MSALIRRILHRPDPAIARRLALYCAPTCPGCYIAYRAGREFVFSHELMAHAFRGRRAAL